MDLVAALEQYKSDVPKADIEREFKMTISGLLARFSRAGLDYKGYRGRSTSTIPSSLGVGRVKATPLLKINKPKRTKPLTAREKDELENSVLDFLDRSTTTEIQDKLRAVEDTIFRAKSQGEAAPCAEEWKRWLESDLASSIRSVLV